MRRISLLIAGVLLIGLSWGCISQLIDSLGIEEWMQARSAASESSPQTITRDEDQ
jgi:hypothetical protein